MTKRKYDKAVHRNLSLQGVIRSCFKFESALTYDIHEAGKKKRSSGVKTETYGGYNSAIAIAFNCGKTYFLTAAHCLGKESFEAYDEDSDKFLEMRLRNKEFWLVKGFRDSNSGIYAAERIAPLMEVSRLDSDIALLCGDIKVPRYSIIADPKSIAEGDLTYAVGFPSYIRSKGNERHFLPHAYHGSVIATSEVYCGDDFYVNTEGNIIAAEEDEPDDSLIFVSGNMFILEGMSGGPVTVLQKGVPRIAGIISEIGTDYEESEVDDQTLEHMYFEECLNVPTTLAVSYHIRELLEKQGINHLAKFD